MGYLIFLITMHLFPFIISALLIHDNYSLEEVENSKIAFLINQTVCVIFNVITILIIYPLILNGQSIASVLLKIIKNQFVYQDIFSIEEIMIICNLFSFVYALVIKFILNKYSYDIDTEKVSKPTVIKIVLCIAIEVIPIIGAGNFAYTNESNVKICEVCRKQENITDEATEETSYIVIHNNGELPQRISKVYIATTEDFSDAIVFTDVEIASNGTVKLTSTLEDGLDIKKKGGTTIYLSDDSVEIIDSVEVTGLSKNESYKLMENSDDEWEVCELDAETTETTVEEDGTVTVNAPEFSEESGFYDEEFLLTITADSNTKIYYTTDGSIPTVDSNLYTEPIRVYNRSDEENQYRSISHVISNYLEEWKEPDKVEKAYIIRAITVDGDGNLSDIVSKTYFVGLSDYAESYCISLFVDPEDLFGENGIYITGKDYDSWYEKEYKVNNGEIVDYTEAPTMNFEQRGDDWERETTVQFFKNGSIILTQNAGIKIQGASSRDSALKRFTLTARKKYSGSKFFDANLFENDELTHSFTLRSGFLNSFNQYLVEDRDLTIQNSTSVVVFLNGEYWYTTYMQEKYSDYYISKKYNLTEDNVELLRIGWWSQTSNEEKEWYENSITKYLNENDLSDDLKYQGFENIIDIQSFIDYYTTIIYLNDTDCYDNINTCLWRTAVAENLSEGDGRWRWALYDKDTQVSQHRIKYAEINTFNYIRYEGRTSLDEQPIFAALKKNSNFCKKFVLTFMDMVNYNFDVDRVTSLLEEWGEDISYNNYFFQERPTYITQYLAEEFELKGTQQSVTLCMDDNALGTITLNTITPELSNETSTSDEETNEDYTWTGSYFTDYPVTVTANENDGYTFDRWEVTANGITTSYTDKTIEVPVAEGGTTIHAIFK